uniref:Chitinase domain-containing protein 1 n=1 Tax=Hirondellea gigas TaxID=1518452 RepID=A0A2P2I3M3_9CRUS
MVPKEEWIFFLHQLFMVLLITGYCDCTLSKSSKKVKKEQHEIINEVSGPLKESVAERELVTDALKWKDVVEQHKGYLPAASSSKAATLAYVTPWNNRGYDIAKWQGGRFSHVSPVWLQLKPLRDQNTESRWQVTGLQDVDQGWLTQVRNSARKVARTTKIVPRIIFEGWGAGEFQALVESAALRRQLAQDLLSLIQSEQFDGLVLEVWSQLPTRSLLGSMPSVIAPVADTLRAAGYIVILVIPPAVYQGKTEGFFLAEQFQALSPHVDFFSLMSYDYSSLQNPGPNSPLWWMKECVEKIEPDQDSPNRAKILLGLNLYGIDHSSTGGGHVLGQQYVEILRKHKPKIQYDDISAEHFFEYTSDGRRTVFYPSLYSLQQRVLLAKNLNTGISLWEIGQGLDYFYDLF